MRRDTIARRKGENAHFLPRENQNEVGFEDESTTRDEDFVDEKITRARTTNEP